MGLYRRKITRLAHFASLLGLLLTGVSLGARAQTETVLYDFGSGPTDGYGPAGSLLIDAAGNLFGTTTGGSETLCDLGEVFGCGIVFELVKSPDGYTEKIIYSFGSSSPTTDGASPSANLIADGAGNLYGTTTYGGSSNCQVDIGSDGCGTVFELANSSDGYAEKVLYAFTGFDGAWPLGGLIMDSAGNLYGIASGGGANGYGDVFELVNSAGTYTYQVLYSFGASATDGLYPVAGLVMDSDGNLYGTTTVDGGPFNCGLTSCGTVFELVNSADGYAEKILHTFSESEGSLPKSTLIMDSSGNLYGTASQGGANGSGTAFELIKSSGTYTAKVLYSFGADAADGTMPVAGLVMDASGNLFGTTRMGGSATACGGSGCGTVFELSSSSGTYAEKILHGFGGFDDGENPAAAVVMDGAGNLYGTTTVGGSGYSLGTVYEIDPSAAASAATLSASSLSFATVVNTSSSPQGVIVTNTGSANLIFPPAGVSLTGTNASEFAITADSCSGRSIPIEATCAVTVNFSPTIPATETATLNFSDDAVVSVQQVSLTGLGLTTAASVSLLPTRLTFGNQAVLTTSVAQPVTLMNTGGAPLNITGISAQAGFTETNDCGSTLASDASCVIEVSFAPTMGGQQTADLLVTDNATDSPQSVSLIGTGADFTMGFAAGSSASATISPGGTASYALSLSPEGGFNQVVNFSCSGVPPSSSCSVSPSTAKFDGTDNVPLAVSVTTTSPSVTVPLRHPPPRLGPLMPVVSLFGVLVAFTIWLSAYRGVASGQRLSQRVMFLLALAAAFCACSCGGGSTSVPPVGTPAGTYTITVTGTSGALSNAITVTLTVN